jgi:hypothetical protein
LVRLAASNGWTKQPRREAATTTGTIIHTANVTNKEYYEVGWAHITKAPWTISAPPSVTLPSLCLCESLC